MFKLTINVNVDHVMSLNKILRSMFSIYAQKRIFCECILYDISEFFYIRLNGRYSGRVKILKTENF